MEVLIFEQQYLKEKIIQIDTELKKFNNMLYKLQQFVEEEQEYEIILAKLKQAKITLNLKIEPNFDKINLFYKKLDIKTIQQEFEYTKQIIQSAAKLKFQMEKNQIQQQDQKKYYNEEIINRDQFKDIVWFLLEEQHQSFMELQNAQVQSKKEIFDQLFNNFVHYQQRLKDETDRNEDTNQFFVNFTFQPSQNEIPEDTLTQDINPGELSHVKISDILDIGSLPVSMQSDEEYKNKDINDIFSQNYNYFEQIIHKNQKNFILLKLKFQKIIIHTFQYCKFKA